jgi:AraC-like DNA-binding protein
MLKKLFQREKGITINLPIQKLYKLAKLRQRARMAKKRYLLMQSKKVAEIDSGAVVRAFLEMERATNAYESFLKKMI